MQWLAWRSPKPFMGVRIPLPLHAQKRMPERVSFFVRIRDSNRCDGKAGKNDPVDHSSAARRERGEAPERIPLPLHARKRIPERVSFFVQ